MLLEKNKKEAGVYPFEYFILTYPGLSLFRFTSRKSKSGSKLWSMKYKASALTTRPSPRSRNCLINVMGSKRSLNCSKEVITIFVLFKDGPSAGRPGRPKSRLLQSRKGQKFGRLVRNLQEIKGRTQEGLRKERERKSSMCMWVRESVNVFLNRQTPSSFSFIFSLFNQILQFHNKSIWKCPSSIWCRN